MKHKRLIAAFLSCICVCIFGTISASAATSTVTYGDFTYTVLYNNCLAVTGCSSSEASITIPSNVYGRDVIAIQDGAFYDHSSLTSVVIPDSITLIGHTAFAGCSSLTNIEIPSSVTKIGYRAFYGCKGLTDITIPDSVTSIGQEAFYSCSSLGSVVFGNKLETIEDGAFGYCGLRSITIPDTVTSIGKNAFDWNTHLTNITIGTNVTSIGNSAFSGCFYLEKINWKAKCVADFNASYKKKNLAFDCAGQKGNGIEVIFDDNVERIPAYLFDTYSQSSVNLDIPKISSVTIGANVLSIGEHAFYNCRPKNIMMSKSVQNIEDYAFYGYVTSPGVYYDGTEAEWSAINIESGNDALKNASWKSVCYINLVDSDATTSVICTPGEKLNISEIEKKYMHRVTLYTDSAMTEEFDPATPVSSSLTLYVKLGEEITGVTVSGTAASWNNTDNAVFLLYDSSISDADIKADMKLASPEKALAYAAVKGGITQDPDGKRYDQTFSFNTVSEGTYKLAIFKSGKYVPKIVEITVGSSDYDCGEQKLWLYGDVNYDGAVNKLGDILNLNRYCAGVSSVFDTGDAQTQKDRFDAANVTAITGTDTVINKTGDILNISRYIAGYSSVLDKA